MLNAGLEKTSSSKVRIEEIDGKDFVVKTLSKEEAQNDYLYYEELRKVGLTLLESRIVNDHFFVEYIKDAVTLGDRESGEGYKKFGEALRKLHAIKFPQSFSIDGEGRERPISWPAFIDAELCRGIERQASQAGFDAETVRRAVNIIEGSSIKAFDGPSSLLHCDTHQNNVLLIGEDLLIIDKGSAIFAGDPLYDLALLPIVLPGSVYLEKVEDKRFLGAFIEGYGHDFTLDRSRLDGYVLLRAIGRWPNGFEVEIPEIVEGILSQE